MRTQMVSKFALAASLALAFTFTLGCGDHSFEDWLGLSSDSSSDSLSSSSGGSSSDSNGDFLSSSSGGLSSGGGGSSSSNGGVSSSNEGDIRAVVIGTQTWMAENLNYAASGSKCYDNDPAFCDFFGRLYDWATAMALPSSCNSNACTSQINTPHQGICPQGWHIPSKDDWDILINYAGGLYTAGKRLKAKEDWSDNGGGTDDYGFSALPGGLGDSDGSFESVGDYGAWWSATEDYASHAYYRSMVYGGESVSRGSSDKAAYYSVRCLQD